jgi:two-component system, sensor histidine kinase
VAERARGAIRHQITHLGRLVDDLLDITHVTSGDIALSCEPLNLATSVQRSVSDLASTGRLERHVIDVRAEPVWANADPARLNQIVANLLTNAIKYTSPGGTICVRVGGEEDQAVVGVADTGIGIPPSLLPHVFDLPVQGERRLDRAQAGLGVGLTLVRRLVDLHGGRVEVFSEGPGRGSEFLVRLPRIQPAKAIDSQSVLRVVGKVASAS